MSEVAKKNVPIQIIRISAMISIILCHLLQEVGNSKISLLSQFFNVGVFIFLFLSGYLYGNKKIDNPSKWLVKRFVKLMIPIYIFMMIMFILQLFNNTFQIKYVFIYLFNLQRILGSIQGAGHLWFMTVLMFCYFITPVLNNYKKRITKNYTFIIIYFMISILLCFINEEIGQILLYLSIYICGYLYRNQEDKINIKPRNIIILSLIAIVLRVGGHILLDETILYDRIIVSTTHLILSFMFIITVKGLAKNIKSNQFINHFDSISYYIYIVHYPFMVGPVRTMGVTSNLIINTVITIFASYIIALLLKAIVERLNNIKLYKKVRT